MNRITAWSTIIAGIVIAGCAGPRMTASECKTPSGKCDVDIRVTEPCNTAGNIVVVPDPLELDGKPNVSIKWDLPRNYRFCPAAGDGIAFKGATDNQFFDPDTEDPQGGGCFKKFKWKDKNDTHTWGKSYSYLIQFTGPNGTCKLDPFIRNG